MKEELVLIYNHMDGIHPIRNLYRSRTSRVLAGIFGGMGEHWHIDPVILRLIWVLVTAFTGFIPGIIVYIIAIFIIPEKPLENS